MSMERDVVELAIELLKREAAEIQAMFPDATGEMGDRLRKCETGVLELEEYIYDAYDDPSPIGGDY